MDEALESRINELVVLLAQARETVGHRVVEGGVDELELVADGLDEMINRVLRQEALLAKIHQALGANCALADLPAAVTTYVASAETLLKRMHAAEQDAEQWRMHREDPAYNYGLNPPQGFPIPRAAITSRNETIGEYLTRIDEHNRAIRFHPRAWKLMTRQKPFVVVSEDEPYYILVYNTIRQSEMAKGTWSAEDEQLYWQIYEWACATKMTAPEEA